jgi:hypothetical protein
MMLADLAALAAAAPLRAMDVPVSDDGAVVRVRELTVDERAAFHAAVRESPASAQAVLVRMAWVNSEGARVLSEGADLNGVSPAVLEAMAMAVLELSGLGAEKATGKNA